MSHQISKIACNIVINYLKYYVIILNNLLIYFFVFKLPDLFYKFGFLIVPFYWTSRIFLCN